ncbi:unnamed protein product [Trichobilharzia regenti]|nr:unnamed protein product [Trichobilharzia regenti]
MLDMFNLQFKVLLIPNHLLWINIVSDAAGDSKSSNVTRPLPGDGPVNVSDIDPEAVRLALREFVQKYSSVKRDYEDAQAQITSLHSRLNEQAEQTEQWARRLHQLQQALCEAEAGI